MMEWQELNDGFSMATVDTGDSIDGAMAEFCKRIREDVIPRNSEVAWDYLRVEFWSDSGRMIAFPANNSNPERIEKAGCQVVFQDLLAEYEMLADSEMEDNAFTTALIDVENTWISRFLSASRAEGLQGTRVQFWDGGADEPILEEHL